MPSAQRGSVVKRGDRWSARWRDEQGRSRRRTFGPGREGKAAAAAFLDAQVDQVEAVRRGESPAAERSPSPSSPTATSPSTKRIR